MTVNLLGISNIVSSKKPSGPPPLSDGGICPPPKGIPPMSDGGLCPPPIDKSEIPGICYLA